MLRQAAALVKQKDLWSITEIPMIRRSLLRRARSLTSGGSDHFARW
jgi:hypothetical protein